AKTPHPAPSVFARKNLGHCFEVDMRTVHRRKPHCTDVLETMGGQKYTFRYNALGLRDKDYSARARAGTTRVLLVSDSVGNAHTSSDENQMLSRVIQSKLGGRDFEVINGSQDGTGLLQNAVRLRSLLPAYNPHLVLLSLVWQLRFRNDAEWFHSGYADISPGGRVESISFFETERHVPRLFRYAMEKRWVSSRQVYSFLFGWMRLKTAWRLYLMDDRERLAFLSEPVRIAAKNIAETSFEHGAKPVAFVYEDETGSYINIFTEEVYTVFEGLFAALTPAIRIDVGALVASLRGSGIEVIHLSRGPRGPRVSDNLHPGAEDIAAQALSFAEHIRRIARLPLTRPPYQM
ncbi:MAG: hypothetical protein HUU37_11040, partial [Bdellovibrionales bacterium]|nr:hypothetical protein [Bdellovibrionales bacterium]